MSKLKHLHYDLRTASDSGASGHPQKVMKGLGITYQICVPQSISDSWEFWNCQNVPNELPEYLTVKDWNPLDRIGWGLSKEDAEKILNYQQP